LNFNFSLRLSRGGGTGGKVARTWAPGAMQGPISPVRGATARDHAVDAGRGEKPKLGKDERELGCGRHTSRRFAGWRLA
jgi:hypothetical protein